MLLGAGGRIVCCSLLAVTFLGSVGVRAEKPAAAQMRHWPAEKILPAEPGRKACWRRVYGAKHLAVHPRQKVTQLIFFLRVSGYNAGGAYVFKNPDHIYYNFALSLKRHGDKRALATSGDCLGEKTIDCAVDCDRGGVTIGRVSSDRLSIKLNVRGIAFGGDCDTTTGIWVRPGAEDKVFNLDPAPMRACEALEKEQLGGWNDE